ncbi:MAG: sodium:alanine symporter family protein [Oscillospiraceae bacterium]|nr:sodium:alanine symporter family protein [Oscillospiraceae bacterium]
MIWGPALLFLVLGTGFYLTAASGFFPVFKSGFVFKNTFGKIFKNKKAFSAAATAIGATVGTGNIIGVSAAISVGGAGAVFWMWAGAFFGMMLKFAEAALAVKYKGGAMVYIEKAFGGKFFAVLWCFCCVLASFGGGNMIQTNAAGSVFKESFGIPPAFIGILIAVLTGFVLFCGAKTVLKTSSVLVPAMALIYVLGCFSVLFIFRENVFPALKSIFESAFEPFSLGGGILGIITSKALRTGISKGTFTHEAGMGSASLAHCESGESSPLVQGCWGIIEVFIDTIFVCSLTALVILSSGFSSAESAFCSCFGSFGDVFLSVSMFLFALAAVIGWAFYGEKALGHVTKSKTAVVVYRILFCSAAVIGSFLELPLIWNITDIFNGLMIFPNLMAIILLSPKIIRITKEKPAR